MAYSNERRRGDRKVTFDLMENLVVFGRRKDSDWTKEANIVAWNGGDPKLDIREWDPDHERMSKGITLFEDEAERLAKALCSRYGLGKAGGQGDSKKGRSGAYERFTDEDGPFEAEGFAAGADDLPEESFDAAENTMTEEAEEGGTS